MRSLLLATSVFLLLAPGAGAQILQKQFAPGPAMRGPVLNGDDGNPLPGVRLSRANINVVVHGNLAQATMTLTFANDMPRVLGGNLVFPLPEGATVTGYGLEINGEIVDGVAVEKEQARIIYETEIHKRVTIDPGLVENIEGNAFRTRLYPIPARGARSIKIVYVTQIGQGKDGATLSLPLSLGDLVDEVSMRVEVPEAKAAPIVKAGGIEGLTFAAAEHGYVAVASVKNPKTSDELVVALAEMPVRSVAVEKRLKYARTVEELEGNAKPDEGRNFDNYFLVTDTPAPGEWGAARLKNYHVGIVWDASLSRGDADHVRELRLLESVLNHLGNPGTDLIVLRNDVQVQATFADDAAGVAKLIETIKTLPYDGATALGTLTFPKNTGDYSDNQKLRKARDYDCFLLFTDGLGNIGADRPQRAQVPVYAMSDDVQANHSLLRAICQESGGSYFNLKRVTDEQVLAGVGHAPFSLVSMTFTTDAITDVYPAVGAPINGRFMLTGKLIAPKATLTLHYGYGYDVVASETFTISAAGASEGSLLPRFWAQQKVTAFSLFPDKNAGEITRLGKQFNLVTPNTSLLVLETAEQYVQYRVVPPPGRTQIYREFLARIEESHTQFAWSQKQKIDQVWGLWDARVQWWEQKYQLPKMEPVASDAPSNRRGSSFARILPGNESNDSGPVTSGSLIETTNDRGTIEINANPAADTGNTDRLDFNTGLQARESGTTHLALDIDSADGNPPNGKGNDQPTRHRFVSRNPASNGLPTAPAIGGDNNLAIAIRPWDPRTPYIASMRIAAPEQAYDVYLAQRADYARSPAFYFDCADYLISINQRQMGIRVLTNIVELELHDARLLRVAAHRLNQIGERDLAIDLFEKVLKLRPEEPQSYRDLALALADRADAKIHASAGNPQQETVDNALADYSRSLNLLNTVVLGNWPRFPEIELPVLMEANDIAAKAQRIPGVHDFHNPIDPRLQKNLDCDVRVVMTWDADQTDIDLWVTEPTTEKCFYGHNRTQIGGLLSHDFTDGYGPEEYCLHKLMPGKYNIQANFYGSRQQELTGPATVQATVITNFGRPNEKRQAMCLRLKDVTQVVDVGTVTLGDDMEPKLEAAAGSQLSQESAFYPTANELSAITTGNISPTLQALIITPWIALFVSGMVGSWIFYRHRSRAAAKIAGTKETKSDHHE